VGGRGSDDDHREEEEEEEDDQHGVPLFATVPSASG